MADKKTSKKNSTKKSATKKVKPAQGTGTDVEVVNDGEVVTMPSEHDAAPETNETPEVSTPETVENSETVAECDNTVNEDAESVEKCVAMDGGGKNEPKARFVNYVTSHMGVRYD